LLIIWGCIRVHGELWQAEVVRGDVSIERGEPVRIRGIKGLRLQVERKKSLEGAKRGPSLERK